MVKCAICPYGINQKQEIHGPHRSPWKRFQSINTLAHTQYDYIIRLVQRQKYLFFDNLMILICKNLSRCFISSLVEICPLVLEKKIIYVRYFVLWVQICDATGHFVKALTMGQNIVLDKSYTKQLGQISILEHCKRQ